MCHESSGAALNQTVGVGKGTVTLEDIERTDCLLVIGQNPGTNHPRMLTSMEQTVLNGGKIISVNPLLEAKKGSCHYLCGKLLVCLICVTASLPKSRDISANRVCCPHIELLSNPHVSGTTLLFEYSGQHDFPFG